MLGCTPATGSTSDLHRRQVVAQAESSGELPDVSDMSKVKKRSDTTSTLVGDDVSDLQNSEAISSPKDRKVLPEALSTNIGSPEKLPIYYASQPIFLGKDSKDNDVSEWSKASNWISAVALLLSLSLAGYTAWKDIRARRLSINDEYWLRKVVGPIAVEPLLKSILDMIASAPEDNSSTTFNQASVDSYHQTQVKMLSLLAVNATTLQLIDANLATSVASQIDSIQDDLIDYCGAQQYQPGTAGCISKGTFQQDARTKLISLLHSIKVAHTSIR